MRPTIARLTTIGLVALLLLTAPLTVGAQPVGKVYRIGILGDKASDPAEARLWRAFRLGLRERGWIEGTNILIEYRWVEGNAARQAGRTLGVQLQAVGARTGAELEGAFSAMARDGAQAVLVLATPFFFTERQRVAELASRHRLPTMLQGRDYVEAGGLMSYYANYDDLWRRAAIYVDKMLRGAKPADLPVEQPTKFEFVINMKTAKALGLTIPPSLLFQADQVIE